MARNFLENVQEVEHEFKGLRNFLWRFFTIVTIALIALAYLSLTQASAQGAFPQGNDALAKYRWE